MPIKNDSSYYLQIARDHLAEVQAAAFAGDRDNLSKYGLLCLETPIRAVYTAGDELQLNPQWNLGRARALSGKYPLPDITVLLENLNAASSSEKTELSALDIAFGIEDFFDCVHAIVNR